MNTQLASGIDWVGYVDWNVRDFHGYATSRGSTYNAYLVRDEKTAIIDTVKAPHAGDLLARVAALKALDEIDYVVCNHAEPDHGSGIAAVMRACPQATVVCSSKCHDSLSGYHDTSGWEFKIVGTGDALSLGARNLAFLETPMVHWPDSMMTYCPEEKLLFSQDGFGQHYASAKRFDDEVSMCDVLYEAKSYYANIIMWAGRPIAKALEAASGLDIEMIAPSHGVIWRGSPEKIIQAYQDWVVCASRPKVLIAYDTMWQSTEMMAEAIGRGANQPGVEAKLFSLRKNNITLLATEVLDSAVIAFGSPTLNGTMMPQMAAALTYLKGLRPTQKLGMTFGSYGWGARAAAEIGEYLDGMKFEIAHEPIEAQWRPTPEVLAECEAAGKVLAQKAIQAACAVSEYS